jgi:hypothetical protein
MSYVIAAISNSGGAPEQAYRKMQSAGACPERPFAGKFEKVGDFRKEYVEVFLEIPSEGVNQE